MPEVLGGGQALDAAVAVGAVVVGAGDLAQVGGLVEGGGGLVLAVAGAGEGREGGEVEVAVDHVGLRRQGVGEDAAGAGAVHVGAVEVRDARGRAAALGRDALEDGRDGAARRRRARLEVLGHLGGRAGRGGCSGGRGQRPAVADGRVAGRELGARAVGLHVDALVEAAADRGGGGAVDLGGHGAAGDRVDAGELGRVGLGVRDGAQRDDVVLAARAEVVDLADVEGGLDRLARRDDLEGLLVEPGRHDAETDAVELELVA